MQDWQWLIAIVINVFPSPHSGILFLSHSACMRPSGICTVSVPSFGDSFFIQGITVPSFNSPFGFRPLIRGFFFYLNMIDKMMNWLWLFVFPSPHSGILFLLLDTAHTMMTLTKKFPSPHSGILFL